MLLAGGHRRRQKHLLGLPIQVKVEIIDEAHLSDEAVMELGHIESLDFRFKVYFAAAASPIARRSLLGLIRMWAASSSTGTAVVAENVFAMFVVLLTLRGTP